MYEFTIKTSKAMLKIAVDDINDIEVRKILENEIILELEVKKIKEISKKLIKK